MHSPGRFSAPGRVLLALFALASLLVPSPAAAQAPVSDSPSQTLESTVNPESKPQSATLEPEAPGELRGMWVVCYSLRSPATVHQVVVTAKKYHLNALFVQVRSRGDAWYDSPFEPRAEGLAHQPRRFDPLAQIVAEGHAAGIQVHAWLNTYLTWSQARRPYAPDHLWNAHRDWFAHDRHGRLSTSNSTDCEGVFLQPSCPEVQEHLFRVFTDVASRYDVDGIHFDYVRYPNQSYDFSASTLARFREYMHTLLTQELADRLDRRCASDPKAYVHAFGREWETWRRAQVTGLVARIAGAARAEKPWMQVSAAVFANADDARDDRGQDWIAWLKERTLDAVALMAYATDTRRIMAQTRRAVAAAGPGRVYTGIGAWRLSAHDVARKIAAARSAGAAGINLFSYDGVHDRSQYLATLAHGVFSAPQPRMEWLAARHRIYRRDAIHAVEPDAQITKKEK